MNKSEFLNQLNNLFKDIDINHISNQIDIYVSTLNEYNSKFNLTRLNKEQIIYSDYFFESILPYQEIDFKKINTLLDIGSGSGIPGMLIKIIYPHIHLDIVEANGKKCHFLNILKDKLNLKNVNVYNKRCEEYAKDNIEKYDMVTCRAVAELKILIELGFPLTKINGLLVFPKSINYLEELNNAKWIIDQVNANQYEIKKDNFNNKEFNTFVFTKTNKTNSIFPRMWKDIIK